MPARALRARYQRLDTRCPRHSRATSDPRRAATQRRPVRCCAFFGREVSALKSMFELGHWLAKVTGLAAPFEQLQYLLNVIHGLTPILASLCAGQIARVSRLFRSC